MKPVRLLIHCIILCIAISGVSVGQVAPVDPVITQKVLHKLDDKAEFITGRLEKQTARYLAKMSRQEQRLKKKWMKFDSSAARSLFNGTTEKYRALSANMTTITSVDYGAVPGEYIPLLDSIKGMFQFLDKNAPLIANGNGIHDQLGRINKLQNSLRETTEVTDFLKQRKKQLAEALQQYTKLPKGISGRYNKLNQQAYYYHAQVNEYKSLLKDPSKIEQKALEVLRKVPAFSSFMQKHSFLATLFNTPANHGNAEPLAGLQTREQVQQLISNRMGTGGVANAQEFMQGNMQAAQGQLQQLKNKINELGDSKQLDMPDFKPNSQKTKRFKERITLGGNLQTVKSNRYFPATSDLAGSAGFKLNDKSEVGIGASYKLGLGKDIRHIAFTSEGLGLRSYLDFKLKGSFWLSGGAEMNYRARFGNFEALKGRSGWQQSALIGLSKKYQVSKKVKGNAQLLFDALWKQQVPRTQAVVFRIGYLIK